MAADCSAAPAAASSRLAYAWSRADEGDSAVAIDAARSLLQSLEDAPDLALQGEAMLCEASCELRLIGRFERAFELARKSAQCFHQADDALGECRALATQSVAATRLGLYEIGVDCASLAIRIVQALPACRERVMAHEALGVAMFAGGCHVDAGNAFQQAIDLARDCTPPLDTLELHIDLASAEAHRHLFERAEGGRRLSLMTLEYHLDRCTAFEAREQASRTIALASRINNEFMLALTRTQWLTWQERWNDAKAALVALEALQKRQGRPWAQAAVCWARAELALARGFSAEAVRHALEMEEIAKRHHHHVLLGNALHLQRHIFDVRGDVAGGFVALRKIADRDQRARAQSLRSRASIVDREVALRRATRDLQRLESDSRRLERLALEDSLTGLANRHRLDHQLTVWLGSPAPHMPPPCVLMVDIDHLRRINETFTRRVGDEVLRAVSGVLLAHTRENDLAVRLQDDEFVVVLRGTSADGAAMLCGRIRDAVRAYDWSSLAPGLAVTISAGMAVAQIGDSPSALLARGDRGMYADKRRPRGE